MAVLGLLRSSAAHGLARCILPALLAAAAPGWSAAQERPAPEHQLEAVFLYHFAQFVTWPLDAFEDAGAPLVIGVLGEDPFGSYLDEVVRDEVVGTRRLAVRRFERAEDVDRCHILFVGRDQAERIDRLLRHLEGRPVLTVSEGDGFARAGGIVEFYTDRNRVRFRINDEAARAAELAISSKLLRLADIVRPGRS